MLTPYVTWTSYWPHGGIEKQRYGNALVRTRMFNSRLQLWQDWDAINDSPNYFLSYESYAWGSSNNDGNLQARGALSGGPGNWYSLTQQYSQFYDYDSLNRITSSSDYSSGMCNGTCWSRKFSV